MKLPMSKAAAPLAILLSALAASCVAGPQPSRTTPPVLPAAPTPRAAPPPASACVADTHVGMGGLPLEIASIRDLGALQAPDGVTSRDGGASARVGGKVLWVFNDTLFDRPAEDGQRYRSSTAGIGSERAPLTLSEPLDRSGLPLEMLPFSARERAYNDKHGPKERWALWPGSVIEGCDGGALIFYLKLKVHPRFLDYELFGVGAARAAAGATTAARDVPLLFNAPEPPFHVGALVDGPHVFLYACEPEDPLKSPCRVARAPRARASERAAWEAWDGASWTPDLGRAKPVLGDAPGDLSVSWNPHLGRFLAVHSEVFGNAILLHTAPRPEGPWTAPIRIEAGLHPIFPPGKGLNNYAAKEHPELSPDGGKTIIVSYAHPLSELRGEIRLLEVRLR